MEGSRLAVHIIGAADHAESCPRHLRITSASPLNHPGTDPFGPRLLLLLLTPPASRDTQKHPQASLRSLILLRAPESLLAIFANITLLKPGVASRPGARMLIYLSNNSLREHFTCVHRPGGQTSVKTKSNNYFARPKPLPAQKTFPLKIETGARPHY